MPALLQGQDKLYSKLAVMKGVLKTFNHGNG